MVNLIQLGGGAADNDGCGIDRDAFIVDEGLRIRQRDVRTVDAADRNGFAGVIVKIDLDGIRLQRDIHHIRFHCLACCRTEPEPERLFAGRIGYVVKINISDQIAALEAADCGTVSLDIAYDLHFLEHCLRFRQQLQSVILRLGA